MLFSLSQSSLIPIHLKIKKSKTLQTKSNQLVDQTLGNKKRKAGVFTSCVDASFTIEASMVLTIFILLSYCMLYPFFVLDIHMKLQAATELIAQKKAWYNWEDDGSLSLLLQEKISSYSIGDIDYEDTISVDDSGIIDCVVEYQVSFPFPIKHAENFLVRSRRKSWIDYENVDANAGSKTDYVYIASSGQVYHLYEDCTYLKLSIQSVDYEKLSTLRNDSGGIYYACERCRPDASGVVYVTSDGNRYHRNLSCSGLKRQVQKISKDDVTDKTVCSRCQKRFNSGSE